MKTLKSYVNEGFYKNVGSDVKSLIYDFVRECIYSTSTSTTLQGNLENAIIPDGPSYMLDLNELCKYSTLAGRKDTVHLMINNDNVKFIDDRYLKLFKTKGELEGIVVRGTISGTSGPDDKVLKKIKEAFPTVGHKIVLSYCPITTLKDCPEISGDITVPGSNGKDRIVEICMTNIRNLQGCPDCDILKVSNSYKLKSLSGSNIKRLKALDASMCKSLKTLKGAPMMDSHVSKLVLNYSNALDLTDLPNMLPNGCLIDSFSVDGDDLVSARCDLSKVTINELNVFCYADRDPIIDPKIIDELPPNVTDRIIIHTYMYDARNSYDIMQMLEAKYPNINERDILICRSSL